MTLAILAYFAVTLATLIALGRMILQVGRSMGDCPQTGAAARAGSVAITAGFIAIGMGGVILVSAVIPALAGNADAAELAVITLLAVGLACVTLGLGFAHALGNLKAIVRPRPAAPTPMEPVLA
ncbi:MAG: hypothetical protein RLZZ437_2429 [Pseudomonadota bacterium]|jgi:hypothetical protein